MSDKKAKDNMELWNQVCKTDPAITTEVNLRGGFTAICAQKQIKRATEEWGSYGGDWGVKDCHYDFINTPGKEGEQTGIYLTALFYCPISEFEIASDMFYGPHNDCMKKLLTDVTTKALSKLGFNSDVFEGKFDDDKYVAEMREEFKKGKGKDKGKDEDKPEVELPDNANKYLISTEIKAYVQNNIKLIKLWGFEIDVDKEIEHRNHLVLSFGKYSPAILSKIRWVRVRPNEYNWEAFKKAFPLNVIWKELKEENQISTLKQWIKENG